MHGSARKRRVNPIEPSSVIVPKGTAIRRKSFHEVDQQHEVHERTGSKDEVGQKEARTGRTMKIVTRKKQCAQTVAKLVAAVGNANTAMAAVKQVQSLQIDWRGCWRGHTQKHSRSFISSRVHSQT